MEFSKALETLLPYIDQVYDRWEADSRILASDLERTHPESPITCSKGCGACCHFPLIPATAGEAFVLLARLMASGQTMEALHARFSEYATTYFAFARERGTLPFTDDQQKNFLRLNLPCPLFERNSSPALSFGGHCGAYGARPLICDYYNSTDNPALCALKKPHLSYENRIQRGEVAIEEIRIFERETFGASALGHLPLLLGALCTQGGMRAFLDSSAHTDLPLALLDASDPSDTEATRQSWADFRLYCILLHHAGYDVGAADLEALASAQNAAVRAMPVATHNDK